MVGYDELDKAKAEARKPRQATSAWASSTYIEVCGVAPSKWIGAVGEGWGAAMWESANIKVHLTGKVILTMGTQPQGQGHETTYSQIIAYELGVPMDDIIVQHSDTQGTPFGYGSYGSRTGVGRRHGGGQGRRQDPREGPALRRAHARGVASTTSRSTAPSTGSRARPSKKKTIQEIAFALDLGFSLPDGHGAVPRRDGLLRHPELHVAVRDPHRRRRDRRGDRRRRPHALRRGRRRRQEDQPDDRRRPAPRRHRPGRRPGALGGGRLRRRRPAPVGLDARLRPAARVVAARRSSSTRRSRRRRSTRSGSRASARPARSPAPRPWPTPSMDALHPLGIRHLDMPLTAPEVWRRHPAAKGGPA